MRTLSILFVAFLALSCSTGFAKAQDQCSLCETVVTIIENWVESNATISQIEQYLQNLCALVPAYQTICDTIVDQGVAEIVELLEQEYTPDQVCVVLGLCTSVPKPAPLPKDDIECESCEEVISVIEQWLENSDNQQTVVEAVEIVCTYMPDWEQTCDAIVEAGVPEVITWIETYENETVVCGQLGLCSAKVPVKVPPKAPQDQCSTCTTIIGFIESWVEQNSSITQIEAYLDAFCALLPDNYQTMCEQIIQTELPAIIAYIEADEDPDTICQQLGLCTNSAKFVATSKPVSIN